MRLIPLFDLELDVQKEWKDRARQALDEVKDLPPKERAKAINARSGIWSELKPVLEEVSRGKCWYCESGEVRSDKAVDHFRPKNRVAGAPSDEGYWWLAFDWRNYRYSCTYCNSRRTFEESAGGKQDHFPLLDESRRGKPQEPPDVLDEREQPKLLDPTNPEDVQLLTFDLADGSAAPAVSESEDPVAYARAKLSIEIYHLHEKALQRLRFEKMLEVRNRVRAAARLPKGEAYRNEVAQIARAIDARAEYSAAARVMLKGLRGESSLARTILENL